VRGAPQVGLSCFIRRINCRISASILGLPGSPERERQRQNSRYPARCQETTVSECALWTSRSTSAGRQPRRVDRIDAAWGEAAGVCKPQAAGGVLPPPLPDDGVQLKSPRVCQHRQPGCKHHSDATQQSSYSFSNTANLLILLSDQVLMTDRRPASTGFA
jgi:hypothetical protein